MNQEQLAALHAIVSTGTFRGAALSLHKSQSAVSHIIKKLEDEVGFKLLSRESYRPSLTAEGEIFYRQSTRVLDSMNKLKSTAKVIASSQEAEISLTVSATSPIGPILKVVGSVGLTFPETHVRLASEYMGGPIERLMKRETDLIIATLNGVDMNEVEVLPLFNVVITPVCHKDYPAAQPSEMRTNSEMQQFVQVVVSGTGSGKYEQSRGVLEGGLRWTVSDFATKKEIILARMGWGGLPEHLIQKELKSGVLTRLNVASLPPLHSKMHLIKRRDHSLGIVGQAIWKAFETTTSK